MNKVVLMGRLTRDPDVRYTQGDQPMCIARYTLAVDRRRKGGNSNDPTADFIQCVAFGKSGEHAEKYFHKGLKICVSGRIQTGSYTKQDGSKVYTTEVVVEEQEFAESKGNADSGQNQTQSGQSRNSQPQSGHQQPQQNNAGDFMRIPDDIDEELPFS